MAVHVKLFPTLANLSSSKRSDYDVDWHDGLTSKELLEAEGFQEHDIESCLAIINDEQAQMDTDIVDGDNVELRVAIHGG